MAHPLISLQTPGKKWVVVNYVEGSAEKNRIGQGTGTTGISLLGLTSLQYLVTYISEYIGDEACLDVFSPQLEAALADLTLPCLSWYKAL